MNFAVWKLNWGGEVQSLGEILDGKACRTVQPTGSE